MGYIGIRNFSILLTLFFLNQSPVNGTEFNQLSFSGPLAPFANSKLSIFATGTFATYLLARKRVETTKPFRPASSGNKFADLSVKIHPIGNGYLNGSYALATFGAGLWLENPRWLQASEVMLKASTYTILTTQTLKKFIQQTRPDGRGETSFPSQHTSLAFAFATTVALYHPWYIGAGAYALAGTLSYGRIAANRHFIHDIFFGGLLGSFYAYGIYEQLNLNPQSAMFALTPTSDGSGAQFDFNWKF